MRAPFSLKAALPLAEKIATPSDGVAIFPANGSAAFNENGALVDLRRCFVIQDYGCDVHATCPMPLLSMVTTVACTVVSSEIWINPNTKSWLKNAFSNVCEMAANLFSLPFVNEGMLVSWVSSHGTDGYITTLAFLIVVFLFSPSWFYVHANFP